MNLSQEIVIPIVKDKHNFLNAFFLAKNGGALLTRDDAKTGDTFNEFTGDGFMQPGGAIIQHTEQNSYQTFIRAYGEAEYDQTTDEYKNNDNIVFKFCMEYARKNPIENYVFLIRNKSDQIFHFPTHPGGAAFTPRENIDKTYIVFLECEENQGGTRFYNLVASFSGIRRAPYCSKYLIKSEPSGREGCSLSKMSKQQPVIDAIVEKIQEIGESADTQNLNASRIDLLNAFKNTVSVGLSPQQLDRANVHAAVTEIAGSSTETSVSESSSEYTPSDNERVKNMFADLPSFTQTLSPGENVCADKMIIEMLKTNTKRPSLFSGGRRCKKTTQRHHDSLHKRNKTKRRVYKNV